MIVDQARFPGVVFSRHETDWWEGGTIFFTEGKASFDAALGLQRELLGQGFVVREASVSGAECRVSSISVVRPKARS